MKQYLDLVQNILNNGVRKQNRTGIDTISITGAMLKFDLRDGFPLITTRKAPIKSTLTELEFFIKGYTDKRWLEERGCKFWSDWCNPQKVPYGNDEETKKKMREEPDLGRIYGNIWCNWNVGSNIVEIQQRTLNDNKKTTYPIFDLVNVEKSEKDLNIGKVFKSTNYGDFVILKLGKRTNRTNKKGSKKTYDIQFLYSGCILKNIRYDVILTGNIRDPYYPSACGIGYLGVKDPITPVYGKEVRNNIYKVWSHMLERCYSKRCKEYRLYGQAGIYVDVRWHSFENFAYDVISLPGWLNKIRSLHEYEIDKDYYKSNIYSKDTCVWLSHLDNVLYRTSKAFNIIFPNGDKKLYISQSKCANDYKLSVCKIALVLNGKRKHHKGFKFEWIDDGKIYRYQLPINQLKKVIETLKTNPTDRRMIVSAWDPSLINHQALPPCHYAFQFVSDGKHLDLTFNMRSNDVLLGLIANLGSYGMLLMLVAAEVNMIPRHLVYFGSDVHIYSNHIDGALEQLKRDPRPLPKMTIIKNKPDWTIYDWDSQKDWKLEGYDPHPAIKMEVAV